MEHTPLTVLVVDDEEPVRLYLAAMLRKNGYAVREAPTGDAAINIMREGDGDIAAVISDFCMSGIDGLELAEWNFQDGFRPFIVCTIISDAATALQFLKFGVRDYVAKPVEEAALVNTVHHAIHRRKLTRLFDDDETPLPGNMGVITISARFAALMRAHTWLDLKTSGVMSPSQRNVFLGFVSEFLMNAYEHGSLLLTEKEKTALLESGRYHYDLRRRELECKAKIEVAVSIVGDEVAIHITDDGYGFDYKRYQDMSDAALLARLDMPNGRGVQMAMQYFDSITYSKGGSAVMLTKKIPKDGKIIRNHE